MKRCTKILCIQQIVEVPADDLHTLIKEPPSSEQGVKALERAAASLYKALQAGMDTGEFFEYTYRLIQTINIDCSQCRSGCYYREDARVP